MIDDTIVIVCYKWARGNGSPPPFTLHDERMVRLAKYTGNRDLDIPATLYGTSNIKVDFSKDFKGKREFMVSEVMNS